MKYGIICAILEEINLLKQDIVLKDTKNIAGRDFLEGTLYGKDVVLVMSNVGKVASALSATLLISKFGVDCVIFCGTAGGIDPVLNVGDVVVADRLIQHDVFDGENYFAIPRLGVVFFDTDKEVSDGMFNAVEEYVTKEMHNDIPQKYLDEFKIKDPKVITGTIASGDQFINDKSKNKWLYDNIKNLKCVEMEGASVAQVCYEFNMPFAVIRVISDSANEDSGPDFDRFALEAMCHFTRGSLKAFLSK